MEQSGDQAIEIKTRVEVALFMKMRRFLCNGDAELDLCDFRSTLFSRSLCSETAASEEDRGI